MPTIIQRAGGNAAIPIFQGQSKFLRGFNPSISSASVPEDIWPAGGLIQFPATAGPITFVSTSINDGAGGSGAQTLFFLAVDDEFNETLETITLDGLTPVVTSGSFIFANDIFVATAGASETNEGLITATIGGGLINVISGLAGTSRTCAAIMPAPDIPGTTPHVLNLFASVGKQPSALVTFSIFVRDALSGVRFQSLDIPIGSDAGPIVLPISIASILGAGARVQVQVSEATANNVLVSAVLQIVWLAPS